MHCGLHVFWGGEHGEHGCLGLVGHPGVNRELQANETFSKEVCGLPEDNSWGGPLVSIDKDVNTHSRKGSYPVRQYG